MANSRNEDLLENILGATNKYGEPKSRNEAILQNILGEQNKLLKPMSRIEQLLIEILDIMPAGEISITENGEYDISSYATANVEVSGGGIQGGYNVTFIVDDEEYYFASCEAGNTISAPPTPTVETGTFVSWQIEGNDVTFPYTPNADVTMVANIQTARTDMEYSGTGTILNIGGTDFTKNTSGKVVMGFCGYASGTPSDRDTYYMLSRDSQAICTYSPTTAQQGSVTYNGETWYYGGVVARRDTTTVVCENMKRWTNSFISDPATAVPSLLDYYFYVS